MVYLLFIYLLIYLFIYLGIYKYQNRQRLPQDRQMGADTFPRTRKCSLRHGHAHTTQWSEGCWHFHTGNIFKIAQHHHISSYIYIVYNHQIYRYRFVFLLFFFWFKYCATLLSLLTRLALLCSSWSLKTRANWTQWSLGLWDLDFMIS